MFSNTFGTTAATIELADLLTSYEEKNADLVTAVARAYDEFSQDIKFLATCTRAAQRRRLLKLRCNMTRSTTNAYASKWPHVVKMCMRRIVAERLKLELKECCFLD